MMVRWGNDGVLQANATKMIVNDGEMLVMIVKCSSMMVQWVYDPTLISPSLSIILLALTSPSVHHLEAAPTLILM